MARTQAVYYRDKRGGEPANEFIEALPAKRAAKIDAHIEEHLHGRAPHPPPPEFPISSQIEGELRELRIRFANTRYRVLYQRSGNLSDGWLTLSGEWTPSQGNLRAPPERTRRRAGESEPLDPFIYIDKLAP